MFPGASASAEGEAHAAGIKISGHAGVSAGPQAGISGGFHATKSDDGTYSVGVDGSVAAALGGKGGFGEGFFLVLLSSIYAHSTIVFHGAHARTYDRCEFQPQENRREHKECN